MNKLSVKSLRTILFTLGGAAVGLVYYYFFACSSGCPITSNPLFTALYMAVIAWLVSQLF